MDELPIKEKSKKLISCINKPEEFIRNLHTIFRSTADKERQVSYRKFIPQMGVNFGTPLPVLRIIASEIGKFGKDNTKQVLPLLKMLWKGGSFEERVIVAKVLEKVGEVEYIGSLELVSSFIKDISDWAVCDQLACFGMKPLILSHPDEILPLLTDWAGNENKWIRRFSVVSLRALVNDKRYRISEKEFEVLDLLMRDTELDVKKAVAWMLRDISKKEPEKVFDFLIKHAQNPTKDTHLIIKGGIKKLQNKKQEEILSMLKL